MRSAGFWLGLLTALFLVPQPPAAAQISQKPSDPLDRIRAAAKDSPPACSATGESLCEQVAPKIIANAQGDSPLADNLRRLDNELNSPASDTSAATRAVAWGIAAFRDSGLDVHTEKFSIPATWSEGASHLEIISPSQRSAHVMSVGWSPATARGGLEARMVFAGTGAAADFARLGSSAKGAILLVHSDGFSTWQNLSDEYANAPGVVHRAAMAGAAAILWMSTRDRTIMYRNVNTLTGQVDPLPQAILDRGDALDFEHVLLAGTKIRARLDLPNKIGGPAERENVIAEIPGREQPNEWVLLGAPLASAETGAGDLQNNCNAALVAEAARDILRTGIRPRRSIRFVLFTAEEQGMLGSQAYVYAHRKELDHIRAAVIFGKGFAEQCAGPVTGYSLGGRQDIKAGVFEAVKPVQSLGVQVQTFDAPLGADNFDFLVEGVPTLLANRDQAAHTPGDRATSSNTLNPAGLAELKHNTAIAAVTAFGVAERAEPLGPRQSRAEIEQLLKDTGLDKQMQDAGLWTLWETSERGHLP
jgi:carboxypeptidase Q